MLRVNVIIFYRLSLLYFLELLKLLIYLLYIMQSRHTIGKLSLFCSWLFLFDFLKKIFCFSILRIYTLFHQISLHAHATLRIDIITAASKISCLLLSRNGTLSQWNPGRRLSISYFCKVEDATTGFDRYLFTFNFGLLLFL